MHKTVSKIFFFLFLLASFTSLAFSTTNDLQLLEKTTDLHTKEVPMLIEDEDSEKTATETKPAKEEAQEEKTKEAGTLQVDYIDVGQGDATLINYDNQEERYTILYDTGDWQGDEVVPFLQDEDVEEIDIIIISHPHADHIGQLANVLDNFSVEEVWMTGNTANSGVYQDALQAVEDSDAAYEEPLAGDIFDIGPLTFTTLHPNSLTGDLNDDSLSMHIAFHDISFMFTGDAGKAEEEQIMNRDLPLQADYLQLGHHGSDTSSNSDFIEAVEPTEAIYSAGEDNKYGHPDQEVVSLFEEKGIELYGTDVHGTITVETDGKEATLTTDDQDGEVEPGNKKSAAEGSSYDKDENSETESVACIDINEASEAELTDIKHIGEKRAEDLIEARPFDSLDDLSRVDGIAEVRLEEIKAEGKACVGGE